MTAILIVLGVIGVVVVGGIAGGFIWGVGKSSGWGKSGTKQLKPSSPKPYAYLDVEAGVTQKSVTKVVSGYVADEAMGPYAQGVLDTFDRAEMRRKGIFALLKQEFEEGSLTWDKFSAPVNVALDGILRNAAQLANRIQAFDSQEYLRMGRIEKAGGYSAESDEVRRLGMMRETLAEMDGIQQANDKLLMELEKLQKELTTLASAGYDNETDAIAAEIRKLADETHYYA